MSRQKLFPNAKELLIILPAEKLEALREIAASKGLAVTDYARTIIFELLEKHKSKS